MEEQERRSLWCDGFLPERYVLEGAAPHITGVAWICKGSWQQPWEFRLDLGGPVRSKDNIPWEELLPAEDLTAWLAVDVEGRRIRVSPHLAE
jgi:hypothetical protein